jgi:glycosyltransferase involved in cell wall biosynthesis
VDVLHFHSVPEGAFLARHMRSAKFLSYDDFRFRRGRATPLFWCYRHMLSQFDGLLPVSAYCRRESLDYWRLHSSRAHVFYNGVNLKQFAPDRAAGERLRSELGIGDEPVILYVGRVCAQKGTDILLDACAMLKVRMPTVRLVVAGPALRFGSHDASHLTRRIRDVGGLYLGAVDEAQLSDVFNLCDVFVMPTRRDEMFGMAALEAQACGKPVVCSRHGGLVEVISEESGMFFPVEDHAALADCLRILLEDRALHACLAASARTNAARFSWDSLASQLDSLYGTANKYQKQRTAMRAADLPV